ncbi:GIY-YIG nuclease family protein [Metamycoplasma buccale]|uniref:GIY-YIG nuclease family protein n=1 Tax=Metamycoplasma buccale TaxID=55602 RepID=UPI00398F379D
MISKELIKDVPTLPGVYLWKDQNGTIIYVGKAKNLKARMSQYFDKKMINSYKTPKMLERIASFSTIVVSSDREAFIQERKLIDKYRPFYNVLFPNLNSFPYIRVKLTNELKIEIKNNYHKEKNAIYYGPLPNNKNFKPLIRYLNHLLLSEDGLIVKNKPLSFWEERFEKAKEIMKFSLNFKKKLSNKLEEAIKIHHYEVASFYNSILDLLDYNKQDQQVFLKSKKNIDVFGFYEKDNIMFVFVSFYRYGSLMNQNNFTLEIKTSLDNFVNEFLNEYYSKNNLPDEIVLDSKFENINIDLKEKIIFAKTNFYLPLIELANINAKNDIERKLLDFNKHSLFTSEVNEKLSLILKTKCDRIVLFDNSFFKGTEAIIGVGVYYQNGEPNKNFYRIFNLYRDTSSRMADVEYIRQTSFNYLSDLASEVDVIIVDGGIEQINEVKISLTTLNLNIPVFGLVKDERHETRILIDNHGFEILVNDQDVFNYLSRMQTEVDRFAKSSYHRKNLKNIISSTLSQIKGVGKISILKLIEHFGTYKAIKEASFEELAKVTNKKIALAIIESKNND